MQSQSMKLDSGFALRAPRNDGIFLFLPSSLYAAAALPLGCTAAV
jgi:hypothetical protein